jgi:small GTP-binding protein
LEREARYPWVDLIVCEAHSRFAPATALPFCTYPRKETIFLWRDIIVDHSIANIIYAINTQIPYHKSKKNRMIMYAAMDMEDDFVCIQPMKVEQITFGGCSVPTPNTSTYQDQASRRIRTKKIIEVDEPIPPPIKRAIVVGDSAVGKTHLVRTMLGYIALSNGCQATVGLDVFHARVKFDDETQIILRLDDTGGAERFRSLAKSYVNGVDVVIFVFDVRDSESLFAIKNMWYTFVMDAYPPNKRPRTILVGNKWDTVSEDPGQWDVIEQAKVLKHSMGVDAFFDTSATTSHNTYELLCCISSLANEPIHQIGRPSKQQSSKYSSKYQTESKPNLRQGKSTKHHSGQHIVITNQPAVPQKKYTCSCV